MGLETRRLSGREHAAQNEWLVRGETEAWFETRQRTQEFSHTIRVCADAANKISNTTVLEVREPVSSALIAPPMAARAAVQPRRSPSPDDAGANDS